MYAYHAHSQLHHAEYQLASAAHVSSCFVITGYYQKVGHPAYLPLDTL